MKAKEMFEQLGFIKNTSICYNETNISYEKPIKSEYGECDIESVHFENGYFIYTSTFHTPLKTYGEILRAIYKQMQELGWVDVGDEMIRFYELEEKATPKKPIYSDFEEDDDGDGVIANKAECPTCGYEFEFGTWNDYENHHCVCGQKIDWSELIE